MGLFVCITKRRFPWELEPSLEENKDNEKNSLSGIPYNTCIQPKDLSNEDNIIMSVAPGEGKKSKSFQDDKFS